MKAEWQPIETAPKDGTPIQARIPGYGQDNIIAWILGGFFDSDGEETGCWCFVEEGQEPPDDWTDGVCWEVNGDEVRSTFPTHWMPLPEPPKMESELPEWCSQWAWDEAYRLASQVVAERGGRMATFQPMVARALVAAERRGIEKAAKFHDGQAERFEKAAMEELSVAAKLNHEFAADRHRRVAAAIRQIGGEG